MARHLVIMPVFNESRTVMAMLERCLPWADRIVVVDDGSTDDSARQVRLLADACPQIMLLPLARNQGVSGALLTGFAYAWLLLRAGRLAPDDWIITIDADGQHQPDLIPHLVGMAERRQVDVLLARRDLRHYPGFKWLGNWGLSLWASWLSGHRYLDAECGFRLFRAAILTDILRFFTGRRYGCCQELAVITARRGWRIDNTVLIPVDFYRPGTRVRDGFTNVWMGLTAWGRVTFRQAFPVERRVNQVMSRVGDPPGASTLAAGMLAHARLTGTMP
ncbi:MAG TPA: glycosyltransferase family 2 protein [Symbiobacteriaceae bacterium]